jgi:serine phosphatase RsbU (regulator of sigma subunit)/Tfp pilus assembly protein PilF
MRLNVLHIGLLIISLSSYSQSSLPKNESDSLWKIWSSKQQHDTNRLKAIEKLNWSGYLFAMPDSGYYYAQLMYDFASKKNLKKYMAAALTTQGVSFAVRSNHGKAIIYFNKSLEVRREISDNEGIANCLNNLGMIYKEQGNYSKSIDYFTQSLKIRDKIKDELGIGSSLNNIGLIYDEQNDYEQALKYYVRSLKIFEKIKDKRGIAIAYNNLGMIFKKKGDYKKALEYYNKGLKIKEETGNKQGIANSLNNIGGIYYDQGNISKALEHYQKGLTINEAIGDQQGISSSMINLANIYLKNNKLDLAKKHAIKGLAIAKEVGAIMQIKDGAQSLWEVYKKTGQFQKSLEMFELYISTRDTIQSEESQREVLKQGFKYDYEKKAAADSVKSAEEKKVKDAQIAQQKAEISAKRNQQFMLFGGLVLVAIFAVFIFNRFKVTQKQKNIIEIQKVEVEQQRDEINEKNQLITESIEYAKTIQEAIITSHQTFKDIFTDLFILFKPKDIVSGDFYWGHKSKSNKVFWAAADCTGHGVPGAFMTMIGTSLLNEIIIEKEIEDTNLILDELRTSIIQTMNKNIDIHSNEKMRNGMDIALCCWDLTTNKLSFSGANNPLFLVRNQELIELKGDKQPIGIYKKMTPFTKQTLQIQKGDKIYTFSDGYPDQMNEQESRLKIANFKKLVLETALIATSEQKDIFESTYERWKGNYDQMDDVVLIGVEI